MIVACMALFMALGGVGYAAATIGSAQIKNNSVQGKDIKNRTIKSGDIAKGTISALKGKTGPAGAAGAKGTNGATGATGPIGPSNARTAVGLGPTTPWTVAAQDVATIELPAGNWYVAAGTLLDNDNVGANRTIPCSLLAGGTTIGTLGLTGAVVGAQLDGFSDTEAITLSGLAALPSGGTAKLTCTPGAITGKYGASRINAIQVGSIG